jgi:hypothetical protein
LLMDQLYQPVVAVHPEEGHEIKNVLTLAEFLKLLKEEEDYFKGEESETKLMITRLRKIFYDKWGWNSQLIRHAANIECRYEVRITDSPPFDESGYAKVRRVRRYRNNDHVEKYRLVTYRKNDRVYGSSRYGEVPFIYQLDHQEVLLPEGYYCDIAHVLAGLDAFNNPQIVSPLPGFLSFLYKLLPYVSSNQDIVTWLGDIATSGEDFVFAYIRNNKHPLSIKTEQHYIDINAPGSDMLGDIDSYVIAKGYAISKNSSRRVTDILSNYYMDGSGSHWCEKRFEIFCDVIGLRNWDGMRFGNEDEWIKRYKQQLRDAACFMIYSLTEENLKSISLPYRVWRNGYSDVVKVEILLRLFLKTLQSLINKPKLILP